LPTSAAALAEAGVRIVVEPAPQFTFVLSEPRA